jgi:hypothetical protein
METYTIILREDKTGRECAIQREVNKDFLDCVDDSWDFIGLFYDGIKTLQDEELQGYEKVSL